MGLCGYEFAPLIWWHTLDNSGQAAWMQAIASVVAIWAALYVSRVDVRRQRERERQRELRAAKSMAQVLSLAVDAIPTAVEAMNNLDPATDMTPSLEALFGIDLCRQIIAKEGLVGELPAPMTTSLITVVAMARIWEGIVANELLRRRLSLNGRTPLQPQSPVRDQAMALLTQAKDALEKCDSLVAVHERASLAPVRHAIVRLSQRIRHKMHKSPSQHP